ncbi:E3 ubiquitin-protein ligase SINA-like 7 [Curcuma longa]|uniref:E3 ubiquitin-protein ligase SINA-like 7 n=1 Tax=Curcuma longa TaxID=136217 RepID=UPI003D9FA12F
MRQQEKERALHPVPQPVEKMDPKEAAAEWTTVRLQLDILRCGRCNGRLTPPVYDYQFEKGFVTCRECQKILEPSSSNRNHGLETVMESLSIPCPHSAHGCNEYVPYLRSSIANHEKDCHYAPRPCFVKVCPFEAPNGALQVEHLTEKHRFTIYNFSYDVPLRVFMRRAEPLLVLKASDDGVHFVLLNSFDKYSDHNFSVVSCSQYRPSKEMFCKLTATSDEGMELSLDAPVKEWNGFFGTQVSLAVPGYFYGEDGKLDLEIHIYVED